MGEKIIPSKIYNSRIFAYYIKLFREKYHQINVSELLDYADIKPNAVDDPLEWFTQEQTNKFLDYVTDHFDNPSDIAIEAGKYVYSDKVLGLFKQFSLKLLGIGHAYKNIAKYGNAMCKTAIFSSREISPHKYEITVKLEKWVKEHPLQEDNRMGIFKASALMFSDNMAKVDRTRDGNTIIYKLTLVAPKSEKINKFKSILYAFSLTAIFISLLLKAPIASLFLILFSTIIYLFIELRKSKYMYEELNKFQQSHEISADQIIKTYIEDYEQVDILNRIGKIILKHSSETSYLPKIAKTLTTLKYAKVAFFSIDFNQEFIELKHNHGYEGFLNNTKIKLDFFKKVHRKDIINEVQHFEDGESANSLLPHKIKNSFQDNDFPVVFIPITYDLSILGFLLVTPSQSLLPIGKKKSNFLSAIASQIAFGIHKQQAFHDIVESDRMKSKFISIASHELKTPIQIMMMAISEIEQSGNINDNLPPLKAVVGKLKDKLNNLLNLHRLETNKYSVKLEKFPSIKIYEHVRDEMINSAKIFSHEVRFEGFETPNVYVNLDLYQFSVAIMNLFNNSCKYTLKNGTIIFKLTHNKTEHQFSIIDNGVGISKSEQEKVFIKFYQAANPNNSSGGGIGLGLSIAREIINLHNGDITTLSPLPSNTYNIETDADRPGTCVTINLPS